MTITPFKVQVAPSRIDAIRDRVRGYDWSALPDAGGWGAGVSLAVLRGLADYWIGEFDWFETEKLCNAYPQYRAEVRGQPLHFLHVKGSAPRALLLTHGWPGSMLEFFGVIDRLAFPERFGGRAEEGFDVIIPSLPGYGFSTPLRQPIGPAATADLFHRLVTETLGYNRYIAQGGDWGSAVSAWMAYRYPEHCRGLHLNMVLLQAAHVSTETAEEHDYVANTRRTWRREGGYAIQQATRPQTLAVAMADSPLGVAAWILDKFASWSDLPRTDGSPDLWARYSRDQILANIMLYLVTGSFATSIWMYKGQRDEQSMFLPKGAHIAVPTAIAAFPDPVFPPPPRSLVEKSYAVRRWTEMPSGGHFAAMEEPLLFADDVRAFASSL